MKISSAIIITLLLLSSPLPAQVIDLSGEWKFHVNDKSFWALPDFDDSKWGTIHAPAPWEEEGFNNYDGFAWYRKKFDGRKLNRNENYTLNLGYIDDSDEVYVNGKLVGFSGTMPPKFKTAYNTERRYKLPADIINFSGDNVIAIRVFDVVHGGGIIEGDIGIYPAGRSKLFSVDLEGIWLFVTCESEKPVGKDVTWEKLMVPGAWDQQGYWNYDGFAWYKKTFVVPKDLPDEPMVLVMGKIDDFDKVYLNGQLIGSTNDHRPIGHSSSYSKTRVYPIPPGALKKNASNLIEVLVEDIGDIGGFREGPVGIATQENFKRYFRN